MSILFDYIRSFNSIRVFGQRMSNWRELALAGYFRFLDWLCPCGGARGRV